MVTIHDITIAGFLVGFIGDLLLNLLVRNGVLNAGLRDYFPTHRTLEAMFIAGGLVAFTVYFGVLLWEKVIVRSPVSEITPLYTMVYLFIFGCIVDNFFRYLHLMPTLDGMYIALNPVVSMFFAGGPLVAAYILAWIYYQQIRNE